MINALFKHIYLLLTLQHDGKRLAMSGKGVVFLFFISIICQFLYIPQLEEYSLFSSIFFFAVNTWILFKFCSTSAIVVSYLLIMSSTYFIMAIMLFFFGNDYRLLFIIWQLIAIFHLVLAINKNKDPSKT